VVGRPRRGGGTARTLFLTGSGQCLGAAVCGARLLLCLVTGRGGVEVVSIRSADVQWEMQLCERPEGGSGTGRGSQVRTLTQSRGSGSGTGALQASRPGLA